ncbi:Ras GTPase activating protein ira2 [Nowakowskiella sp. JEL0078]|nr:Ras GTPase activating protein ira2 [Nowakowskiella sp. JEL0078]
MSPWLPNLAKFSRTMSDGKITDVLKMLIELTVKEVEMGPLIQSKIWSSIGEVETLLPFVLDRFVFVAAKNGLASTHCEVLANTTITLASMNMQIVSGKILARLRKVISSTSNEQCSSLVEHPSWVEIAVLVRFILMLSFNNRLDVHQFLPEIFHIVTMLVGIGSPIVRSSIHGIVVNVIQSLSTSTNLDENGVSTLKLILTEISQPKYRQMFNCGSESSKSAFLFTNDVVSGELISELNLRNLENVVNTLLDVMTYGAHDAELSAVWKSRWMALIASTAFQYNLAIQPRSFIALGCLARDDVDDDLLYQILVALRGALTLFEETESNLIVSIVTSLCSIVSGLPLGSRYLKPMFWLAISLAQIGHIPIFSTALTLVEVVVRTLDNQGAFATSSISSTLLEAREPFVDVASQLDLANGIMFSADFPFAFAGTIMKGLKHSSTKAATMAAFTTFLEISAKHDRQGAGTHPVSKIGPDKLGYILPLLPVSSRPEDVFWMAGCVETDIDEDDPFLSQQNSLISSNSTVGFYGIGGTTPQPSQKLELYRRLFHLFSFQSQVFVTLSCAFMVTMLEFSDYDSEALFIYGFLAEAATSYSAEFSVVWENLQPRISQVLKTSQNGFLLQAVQSIVHTVVMYPPQMVSISTRTGSDGSPNSSMTSVNMPQSMFHRKSNPPAAGQTINSGTTNLTNFLNDVGFIGLQECASFNIPRLREKQKKNANLSCSVVDAITGL